MFNYKPVSVRLRDVQKQNLQLKDEVDQNRADLEFVAAMADVEIPEATEDVAEEMTEEGAE